MTNGIIYDKIIRYKEHERSALMYDDNDDFWDIERIMPPKVTAAFDSVDTDGVEISFGQGRGDCGTPIPERRKIAKDIIASFEKKTSRLLFSYKPDIPLFEEVSIFAWPTKYPFYEKFVSDGEKYYRATYTDCTYTPFFSYMPQYNQLTVGQLRYYLKWRSGLRHGHFLKTDFSYILLFIYELLNLENVSTPEKRLTALCTVWLAYRSVFPELDRILSEWVCDFCLFHKLPPPTEKLSSILPNAAASASLKGFYFSNVKETLGKYISLTSAYKYEKSVYYQRNKSVFDAHVIPAASYALSSADKSQAEENEPRKTKTSRDIYAGALCVNEVKCRIDVTYYSTSRETKYKSQLSQLVKYCENGVRAHLGIKSRLSSTGLCDELKKYADEYFENNLPPSETSAEKRKKDEDIRYALYETDTSDFTTGDALEIEERSWQITRELVPDWTEEEEITAEETEEKDTELSPYALLLSHLSPLQLEVLKLLYKGNVPEADALCRKNGAILSGITNEINDISASDTDDIIIEECDVIDDYREMLADALTERGN